MAPRSTGRPRRSGTALVRRSCSSASSRNAYGLAVRISWLNADASVVSRKWTCTRPVSMPSSSALSPSMSRPSVIVSCIVWRTIGWSGISTGPATFSWQAAAWGNSAAIRSSASMRWIGGGFLRPPLKRSTTSERLRFHRQRLWNMGDGGDSTACSRTRRTVLVCRNRGTSASGKLWCGPSDSTTASSLAAACSSKSNDTQNRLRSARPRARLHAPAVGRVHDQVHALGVVEEALEHQVVVRGHHPEHRPTGSDVVDDLVDGGVAQRGGRRQPGAGSVGVAHRQVAVERRPQRRDLAATARPCAPAPRRTRTGWWAACRRRRRPARRRNRSGGSATSACRAGRCRPASTRRPSPR